MEKKGMKEIAFKLAKKCALALCVMILLLVLHIVSSIILGVIDVPLQKLIVRNPCHWLGMSGFKFDLGAFIMMVIEALTVSLVGAILVARHGWWSKKLFVHTAIWYAIYLAVSFGILIYEGNNWGLLWDDYYVVFTIENCLFPLIVIAIPIVITAIARLFVRRKNDDVKETNAD